MQSDKKIAEMYIVKPGHNNAQPSINDLISTEQMIAAIAQAQAATETPRLDVRLQARVRIFDIILYS